MKLRLSLLWLPLLLCAVSVSGQETNDTQIIYTGKLLGYYRVPSLQKFEEFAGCKSKVVKPANAPAENPSDAATEFFTKLDAERAQNKNTILVGTGDNFAPQLEARMFSEPSEPGDGKYPVANKEFYFGRKKAWIFYTKLHDEDQKLEQQIQQGYGYIPTDNVGCFLRAAKYAAIVPGKHDFYFGAERVRQFARFLATPSATKQEESQPVQMLGANLVMKTEEIKSKSVDKEIPEGAFQDWPKEVSVSNLSDGRVVYPWFSVIKIPLIKLDKNEELIAKLNAERDKLKAEKKQTAITLDVLNQLLSATPGLLSDELKQRLKDQTSKVGPIKLCDANRPNNIGSDKECKELARQVDWRDNKLTLALTLPERYQGRSISNPAAKIDHHFATLLPGHNFGLCTPTPNKEGKPQRGCMRFSTFTPLFSFPNEVPKEKQVHGDATITDPEPFVVTDDNVAIFGVVDPNLNEQIGTLNYGWKNLNKDLQLTTHVSAEDPKEALSEQLDYFAAIYPDFKGLKVLLVQATPQRAKGFAANFPDFQIVVSAADQPQSTADVVMSTTWKKDSRAINFLAVPSPYYDAREKKGQVTYGVVKGTHDAKNNTWTLSTVIASDQVASTSKPTLTENSAQPTPTPTPTPDPVEQAFWDRVTTLPNCKTRQSTPNDKPDKEELLKLFVLCSLRSPFGADLALIQSRDLFQQQLAETRANLKRENRKQTEPRVRQGSDLDLEAQMIVDRLIWKGDLATLLLVPGSALKKALEKSEAYGDEETSSFALAVEKGRTFEALGVTKKNGEYLVNSLPIDDKTTYSIATTDYIGAGDTGYPELVKEALNPRTRPSAFTGKLISLSSLVCHNVVYDSKKSQAENQQKFAQYCLPPITSSDYIDETLAEQTPPYEEKSTFGHLLEASALAFPKKPDKAKTTAEVVEQRVQRRAFWAFSLKNANFGFSDLDNNHKDKDLENRFNGVSESKVAATEERDYSFGLDTRLSYFAYRRELFFNFVIDYEKNSLGDPSTLVTVNQKKNRMFGDLGYVFWRRFGREQPNIGAVVSVHGDTQFEHPFTNFTLSNSLTGAKENDQIRISYGRNLVFLGRVGVRLQNKTTVFELGMEGGRDLKALRGFSFENGGLPVECIVDSGTTLKKCVEVASTPATGPVTKEWNATALQQGRNRAGVYWNHTLTIPFGKVLKYQVTQDADWFFVNFHRDVSIDTKFRYNSKNSFEFTVLPNFSIGPTLDLFLFQNKGKGDWLFQRQIGIKLNFAFDLINWREKKAQAKHKPGE